MSSKFHLDNNSFLYVHDPMCSWCWGYKKTLQQLVQHLPEGVTTRSLLGGLAQDTDQPMPETQQQQIQSNWRRIQATIPGVEFNYDFWRLCQPRRSTYPACRAVLVARQQDKEAKMIEAIQNAYYLQARNPSDDNTLCELAISIGLDHEQFSQTLNSTGIQQSLEDEISFVRSIGADSFPSLFFYHNQQFFPLVLDYNHYETTLDHIQGFVSP